MQLKAKLLKWSAGIPVAMLNHKTAEKISVHPQDRISIETTSKNSKEISTIVDIVKGIVKENEIGISSELEKYINFKNKNKVEVNIAIPPKSLDFIKKKLNNHELKKHEIEEIIKDVVNNSLSESEIALFITAVYKYGTNFKETVYLVDAIRNTGSQLKLKGKFIVDKHSVGGVPGNRTTPIVVPICVAAGLTMPKNSSRAITTAAGTADVVETIAKVEFSIKKLKSIIRKTGGCIVWGGGLGMVPADSRMMDIERSLKIDPESQLVASIMSKKLAAGSKYILIDIPYGKNTKVSSKKKALKLKKRFEALGRYFKRKVRGVITDGSQPIGNGIGPVLELEDIIKVLDPSVEGPLDLEKKAIFLAGNLLEMTGKARKGLGEKMAEEILRSGKAFEKFKEIIAAQGGSLKRLKYAKFKQDVHSKTSGTIKEINNYKINSLVRVSGCPVDKSAGIYLHYHVGDKVKKREKLLTIYAESKSRLREAMNFYKKEKPILIR